MKVRSPQTVLIIEDDSDLAEMYQLQLERSGFEVVVATSAQAAIDRLEKHPVNLIVLDILLPGQNGLSVLHELKSYDDWRHLPVVVLSNISAQELGVNKQQLRNLGVVNYLEKTAVRGPRLGAAIREALTNGGGP